jgi:hypothetical protein
MIMGAPCGLDNSERAADTITQQLRRAVETAAAAQKPARRPLLEHRLAQIYRWPRRHRLTLAKEARDHIGQLHAVEKTIN